MNIKVADHAGFCFGVKRATREAEAALERGEGKIYTLGRLIHNDGYTASLRKKGIVEISREDIPGVCLEAESGEKITVIIRAHGEIKENLDELKKASEKQPNLKVLDCTCPYVNKVRKIAAENSGEGKLFLLLGAKDHPEVQGILESDFATIYRGVSYIVQPRPDHGADE